VKPTLAAVAAFAAVFTAAFAVSLGCARAQTYPVKPIRVVTPFPPAGSLDVVGRALVARLSAAFGQSVVLENRPGAGGVIGAESVAKSPPDGYTLLFSSASTHSIAPALQAKLRYDPLRDFAAIVQVTPGGSSVLMVANSAPWKNVAELVAHARAHPNQVSYGTGGIGTVPHLNVSALAAFTGTQLLHVPYKGAALVMPDLIAGRVSFMTDVVASAQSHVLAGKVRALAMSGGKRSPILPDVPTYAESGLPGFNPPGAYMGLWGPAGMPRAVIDRVNSEVNRMLGTADMREQMGKLGMEIGGGTPEAFAELVRRDRDAWAEIVKKAGVKAE
jgi:tripartite-type tricarboxylate transporter receptor subunit TctC